jgi:hypothetical protein
MRDMSIPFPQPDDGTLGILFRIPGLSKDFEKDPPWEIETRDLKTRIKRIYILRGNSPRHHHGKFSGKAIFTHVEKFKADRRLKQQLNRGFSGGHWGI